MLRSFPVKSVVGVGGMILRNVGCVSEARLPVFYEFKIVSEFISR